MNRKSEAPPPNPPDAGYAAELPEYPGYPGAAPAPKWRRYLTFARRLWWVPVLTVAVAVCGRALYLALQPAAYTSTASMWVSGKLQIPESSLYSEEFQFFFGTQIELLQSDKIRQRALARVHSLHPDLPSTPVGVNISQSPKSAVFLLQATGTDPVYAQAYLNALIDEYLGYKKEVRANSSDDTLTSLSEQVRQQEKELKAEQEKLSQFQQANSLAVLQEQANAAAAYLTKLNAQLSDLQIQYQVLDSATPDARGGGASATNTAPLTADPRGLGEGALATVVPPSEFTSARQQIQLLKIQREELSRYLRPKHPKIQSLDEQIQRGEKVIDFYRQQGQDQIDTAKQALKVKIQGVEDSIQEWEPKLMEPNRRIEEFERLKANVQRLQPLYDRLLNLLQTVDVNKNLDQEIVSVMERATPARLARTVAPKELLLAALAGLAAGLGLILLVARWDDRLTSMSEVTEQFEEEIVGQVPDVPPARGNGKLKLVEADDARHMFAESYRNIRSSVLFMAANGGAAPKALLITSAVPSEGKTTVAANLARAMAFAGARVLLIDADLRRGSLHKLLGTGRDPGLSQLLRQPGGAEAFILPTSLPNLSFLPSGELINTSTELFLNARFDDLLRQVHQQFDQIIIDSPPVFAADDAPTLAPKMDGVLFVLRSSFTRARLARQALDLLYQRQAKVLGLIYNRANARSGSYYYYKYADYYSAQKDAPGD